MQFLTLNDLLSIARSSGSAGPSVILDAFKWRQDSVKSLAVALFTTALTLLATVLVAVLKHETKAPPVAVAIIAAGASVAAVAGVVVLFRLRSLYREYVVALEWYSLVVVLP